MDLSLFCVDCPFSNENSNTFKEALPLIGQTKEKIYVRILMVSGGKIYGKYHLKQKIFRKSGKIRRTVNDCNTVGVKTQINQRVRDN
jgi:hypothetical protein